jgi:HD-like signal output (HDOD) protein/CheY-like chemotaxis protein
MNRKRILFVDDEQNVLHGLQDILRRHRRQWDMVFALGGEAALAELERAPFDVVVSDMRMPGMDGATLLRRVQQEYPNVARLVLSGHAEREAVVRALPVAHQFLSKPCDAQVLRDVIERTCTLQTLLHDDTVRTIVGRLDRLPSVPRSYLELTSAITGTDGTLAKVGTIVEKDPAMSAKVLQLVNSAFFGNGQHITSVNRAVVYLGIELIQGLALSAEVFATLQGLPIDTSFSLDRLQEHSVITARLARRLVSDPKKADEAFAAAIVHDIGKIVLALSFGAHYGEVLRIADERRVAGQRMEKELLGVTHAEVGAYLLGMWGLPYSIVEAVAYHHTPRLATGAPEVVAAVHVADMLIDTMLEGDTGPGESDLLDGVFLEEKGLAPMLPHWRTVATRELELYARAV